MHCAGPKVGTNSSDFTGTALIKDACSAAGEQLIRPDGRSTLGLKKLIEHSVQDDDVGYAHPVENNSKAIEREKSVAFQESSVGDAAEKKKSLAGGDERTVSFKQEQKKQKKLKKKRKPRGKAKRRMNTSNMASLQRLTQETPK